MLDFTNTTLRPAACNSLISSLHLLLRSKHFLMSKLATKLSLSTMSKLLRLSARTHEGMGSKGTDLVILHPP